MRWFEFLCFGCVLLLTGAICIFAVLQRSETVKLDLNYYFVVYRSAQNDVSASSLSETATSYGGAGYVLNYDGKYYVTISCYYAKNDADKVIKSLAARDLKCERLDVKIKSAKVKNSKLYKGNIDTLNSLSVLSYECANGLDNGKYSQTQAKGVLDNINNGISALKNSNENNGFFEHLQSISNECEARKKGYLYSKDLRYIQIAIIDAIINAKQD